MECDKCSGKLVLNVDKDLSCIRCGKVIVLVVRREYDSRRGKIRNRKKEESGRDLDRDSEMARSRTRNQRPSNNRSKMVRQGGLFRRGDR